MRNADGTRAAFFIGDGAGVGKGRQLAGLIYESWLKGERGGWGGVARECKRRRLQRTHLVSL